MSEERKLGGFSLFNLWVGAAISIAEIMTGSLIAPIGIKKGIILILLGHLIGCLILSSIGIIGFKEKKPSLVSTRISLGRYGSYIVSIFNIIQLIGWTAIMLIQCTRSVQAISPKIFGANSFAVIVLIIGAIVAVWTIFADNGVSVINNAAVVLLLILSFVMLYVIMNFGEIKGAAGSISVGSALELSIVMPLSWAPLISDYTMAGKSAKGSFWGSFAGYFSGSSFMYIIGLVSAVYAGTSDPISMLGKLNLGLPALLIVILATVTTTFLDVYSAVLSTINLRPNASKKILIIVYTGIGAILALFFPMEEYENFLYMIGSIFAPIFSVVLVDYFIYKKDRSDKIINISGILAAAIGTAAYYIIIRYDLPTGTTLPSMIITSAVYPVIVTIAKYFYSGDERYAKQNS